MTVRTADFAFALPADLIAQSPAPQRASSRLMVLNRSDGRIEHRLFRDLIDYLGPDDIVVANRSRVMPARLHARKLTGGEVELLLLRPRSGSTWTALARHSKRLRTGMQLHVDDSSLRISLIEALGDGEWLIELEAEGSIDDEIRRVGSLPLPPYIKSADTPPDRYQTVYADREGSVAAPTAGLHFTPELLQQIQNRGTRIEFVTLHVGLGTFRPITVEHAEDHQMHAEYGEIPEDTASAINRARARGGRVIAVGTTTTRLLETAAQEDGTIEAWKGETNQFIYPGYRFRAIDALVTNFHLPRSTLLMLVCALAGRDFVLDAYEEAVRNGYRFYSFGDAMLIK